MNEKVLSCVRGLPELKKNLRRLKTTWIKLSVQLQSASWNRSISKFLPKNKIQLIEKRWHYMVFPQIKIIMKQPKPFHN